MSRHLSSTRVRPSTCRPCGASVLKALDEGLSARVDVAELDHAGELAALLANRRTYSLTHGFLTHRDAGRIRGGHLLGTIHAEHRCRERT